METIHATLFSIIYDPIKGMVIVNRYLGEINYKYNTLLTCDEIEKPGWWNECLKRAIHGRQDVRELLNRWLFSCMRFGCCIGAFDYRSGYLIVEQLVMQEKGAVAARGVSMGIMEVVQDYHVAPKRNGGLHFETDEGLIWNLCNRIMSFRTAVAQVR